MPSWSLPVLADTLKILKVLQQVHHLGGLAGSGGTAALVRWQVFGCCCCCWCLKWTNWQTTSASLLLRNGVHKHSRGRSRGDMYYTWEMARTNTAHAFQRRHALYLTKARTNTAQAFQRRHMLYLRNSTHEHHASLSEETCTILERRHAQTQDKPFRGDMHYTLETACTNTGQAFQRRHVLSLRNGMHKHRTSLSEETCTILEKRHAQTPDKPFRGDMYYPWETARTNTAQAFPSETCTITAPGKPKLTGKPTKKIPRKNS